MHRRFRSLELVPVLQLVGMRVVACGLWLLRWFYISGSARRKFRGIVILPDVYPVAML